VAIALSKKMNAQIIGADISEKMLEVGRRKIDKLELEKQIKLESGDSEHLKYQSNTFDAATAAFGVRNFENLQLGLSELHRVLKPGKKAFILEFSKPRNPIIAGLYWFYSSKLIPLLGRIIAKDYSAYVYLCESVRAFPDGDDFKKIAQNAGFSVVTDRRVTFGVVSLYTCVK